MLTAEKEQKKEKPLLFFDFFVSPQPFLHTLTRFVARSGASRVLLGELLQFSFSLLRREPARSPPPPLYQHQMLGAPPRREPAYIHGTSPPLSPRFRSRAIDDLLGSFLRILFELADTQVITKRLQVGGSRVARAWASACARAKFGFVRQTPFSESQTAHFSLYLYTGVYESSGAKPPAFVFGFIAAVVMRYIRLIVLLYTVKYVHTNLLNIL
jgi:hypothetical protein